MAREGQRKDESKVEAAINYGKNECLARFREHRYPKLGKNAAARRWTGGTQTKYSKQQTPNSVSRFVRHTGVASGTRRTQHNLTTCASIVYCDFHQKR